MLAASEQEEAAKALLKLRQHREEALLAQRLVRLQQDIPLGFNLRDIRTRPSPKKGRTKMQARARTMTRLTLAVDKVSRM